MVTTIQHNKTSKNSTTGIFIDLQKAFDSVWHDGIIYRLSELEIVGPFLKLLLKSLKNRNIQIKVNAGTSNPKPCLLGLSQGSILSPLLFILYTIDMLNGMSRLPLPLQYADGCSIISFQPDDRLLQAKTDNSSKLTKWLTKWHLKAKCSKPDTIWFRGQSHTLQISNEDTNICQTTKVLGFELHDKIQFQQQKDNSKTIITQSGIWCLHLF